MELTYNEFDLLTEIAMDANQNDGECILTDKQLLSSMNVSERTYYRLLSSLEEKGIISRHTESIGHYGKKRKIKILLDKENYTEYSKYNT
jgi:CTP-dependent riboflavin kinase